MNLFTLLTPAMRKTCSNCGGSGRPIRYPYMPCEPCDGHGMVPNAEGRELLEVLEPGKFRVEG